MKCVLPVVARWRGLVPCDEEEAITIRVFECDEAPAPAFIAGRRDLDGTRAQLLIEGVNICDADEEMYAAPASGHRRRLLGEREPKAAGPQSRHRRFAFSRHRFNFKAE